MSPDSLATKTLAAALRAYTTVSNRVVSRVPASTASPWLARASLNHHLAKQLATAGFTMVYKHHMYMHAYRSIRLHRFSSYRDTYKLNYLLKFITSTLMKGYRTILTILRFEFSLSLKLYPSEPLKKAVT
jgi:hypothetical protein